MSNKVSDYWGQFHTTARPKLSWLESETIERYVNKRITGNENLNAYQWLNELYQGEFENALIVGCGSGALERDLLRMKLFASAIGIDISRQSIEKAQSDARLANLDQLTYRVFDLDNDDYGSLGVFDLIIVNMAAHHVANLEKFFSSLAILLKGSKSIIVMNEYVGPNRFQHDEKTRSIVNSLLAILPNELKKNHLLDGVVLRETYELTPIEHFEQHDPSEAIRSQDILPLFKNYFELESMRNYGGAINHMLLTGLIQNFEELEQKKLILELLMKFEELLESHNVIESDFCFIIAKKRKSRGFLRRH